MKLNKPEYMPGQELEDGTLYVGVLVNKKGEHYHLSIEKESIGPMNWNEAVKLESCPNVRELSLISSTAYATGLFLNKNFHWSSTEYLNFFAYWYRFSDGNQSNYQKDHLCFVRCVKRYSLQQVIRSITNT